ncbi:MAG TPA: sulfatase [Verrucomicrobiales bacterium]|nr:sulfatase [Verrucomicrobiales bacterium]
MNSLSHELRIEAARTTARRWFLRDCGVGLGSIALASLLGAGRAVAAPAQGASPRGGFRNPLAPRDPPMAAKAKRVIYLFMAGAPSHLDLFDYKPELEKRNGQLPPAGLLKDYRAAFINPNSALLGPKFKFTKHGQSGAELSEILPHLAGVADDLCIIRSMHTEAVNHAPGQILMNTGSQQFGRPSLGAWTLYGLGSQAEDLPGYVVLSSANGTSGGASNWGCGFLPTIYSGIPFRSSGDPILYLSNPKGIDEETQRASLDALRRLNERQFASAGDPEITARIQAFEMAHRLQSSAPELMDLSAEPKSVLEMYGVDPAKPGGYARNCLLARRLVERGVRFVQLFHEAWDQHGDLAGALKRNCGDTDRATAALIRDLKQRGLLEDTLVVWGGEFGRTPMVQGGNDGRDHHNRSYSLWMAGGGVRPGITYGATDDLGFNVASNPVHVHDLNATILHLLGFDHTRLTFRLQGRDYRLTDVHGEVVKGLLA